MSEFYFQHNLNFMLKQLGTTPSELDEHQKNFLEDVKQGLHHGKTYRFKFDERTTKKLPGRVTMGKYLKGEAEPSQRTAEAIVEFYNRNLTGQTVTVEEFSDRPLDQKAVPKELLSLVGNYYGLFTEPYILAERNREAKGVFLCIRNDGTPELPRLSVHMAAEIRSEEFLFDPRLPGVFAADHVENAFHKLFNVLTAEERRRFTYYKGTIDLAPDLETVCMDLKGGNRKTWSIRINIGNAVQHLRLNPQKDRVNYRYGMGLAWMEHDQQRGFCLTKFALIAQRCVTRKDLSLRDVEIVKQLSLLDQSKLEGRRIGSIVLGGICADGAADCAWYEFATRKWGSEAGKK